MKRLMAYIFFYITALVVHLLDVSLNVFSHLCSTIAENLTCGCSLVVWLYLKHCTRWILSFKTLQNQVHTVSTRQPIPILCFSTFFSNGYFFCIVSLIRNLKQHLFYDKKGIFWKWNSIKNVDQNKHLQIKKAVF